MLLDGIDHVAIMTSDTDRLTAFYGEVFGATIDGEMHRDPDGLEGEVCVGNPNAQTGALNPPGTPSLRYHAA